MLGWNIHENENKDKTKVKVVIRSKYLKVKKVKT